MRLGGGWRGRDRGRLGLLVALELCSVERGLGLMISFGAHVSGDEGTVCLKNVQKRKRESDFGGREDLNEPADWHSALKP